MSQDTQAISFLTQLEKIINARANDGAEASYTAKLLAAGPARIAKKVGEEGVEVALAGAAGSADEVIDETADLLYHLLVLLHARKLSLADAVERLEARHREG